MTQPQHAHILQAALRQIPTEIQHVRDYEVWARDFIADDIWHYIQSGSDQNLSLAANRSSFDDIALLPRVLRSVHQGHTGVDMFGRFHRAPLLLAPVAYHGLVHPEAELATVQAAVALQTAMVVSTLSSRRFADIRRTAEAAAHDLKRPVPPLWLQLYSQPTRKQTAAVLQAAADAGFEAIMWTVDAHYKRSSLNLPAGVNAVNVDMDAQHKHTSQLLDERLVFGSSFTEHAPTWEDLAWLRARTDKPILVKGIVAPADAVQAIAAGANGIVVSNHGGRVLDGMVSPLTVLPHLRAAVGADVPLLLDGGIRWGTDMVKALAMGADAVMVGRPQLHALAVAGMLGVAHMLHVLRVEFELAMAQVGCAHVQELDESVLFRA
ncbi:alpha-hydroxy-acid oxidizing protein [Vitreoscilla massiliensis]|uniref:Alpha-hydroxy-acid oxidizing protein n=1 Tax=Vitreoscilla massiliensis TaxID=1689272 RepID=A0ABY4E6I9_9NEIS|nr:alpha-hydroxy acid oxidase [Vitreoscilla massiliensis]UOO90928.1 alpha-hydroxy-acid oxidizing protein [Vitreoscilla massiliensis]